MKKEITIVTRDINFGGAGIYTQGLVKQFLNDGYRVNLIAPDNLFGNKINFIKINLVGKFFITKELFFFFQARKLIFKNNLENTIILSMFNIFGKGLQNLFFVRHTEHFGQISVIKNIKFNFKVFIGFIFHKLYKIFDYLSIKYAKKVIFVSKNTLNQAKKYYKSFKNKFYYIPNFIEIKNIDTNINIGKNKEKIFFFAGRLEPLKGIDKLCEILEKNKEKLENQIGKFKLIIAGDGILKEKIKKYDFVDYRGKVDKEEIIKLYKKSDLFIFPSLYENFPTVILEAMLYGNLILSRRVGDVEYMLDNNKYQIFEKNAEIIDKIIELFVLQKEEQISIVLKNREKVKQYNIKKIYLDIKKIIYEKNI